MVGHGYLALTHGNGHGFGRKLGNSPMAIHKLKPIAVTKLGPGLHSDGNGLYLAVGRSGARSWVVRYMLAGRTREMGIGSAGAVSLAEARRKAQDARKLLADKVDPIAIRDAQRDAIRLETAKAVTFDTCATAYVEAHRPGWKNAKHAQQWTNTLHTYASPVIGKQPVQAIETEHVLKILQPIWTAKPETAHRVRGRIEKILDWAKVMKYRAGENPARWRGHLDHLLAARDKVKQVTHHAALPYRELPEFMAQLREQSSLSAKALEFTILTAARTNEVIAAQWGEIDFAARMWTAPGNRMKSGREHRVPLSDGAIAVLKSLPRNSDFFFPGGTSRAPHMSNMAMLVLLGRIGHGDLTTHGFRSTFKDWARECTNYPGELSEAALAHVIGDKTEAAYARGDLFDKRRKLMNDWATYCDGRPARKR
jgi:integrase